MIDHYHECRRCHGDVQCNDWENPDCTSWAGDNDGCDNPDCHD